MTVKDRPGEIVIIGGKLQGTESCYLAMKAGYETVLVDKDPKAPARLLCGEFICADLFHEDPALLARMKEARFVLPALENDGVLSWLSDRSRELGFLLAFDWQAYGISSSKGSSDRMFREQGLPVPLYHPEGSMPYIAKPVGESGSAGVVLLDTQQALGKALASPKYPGDLIIQEYLEGPSYSVEVVGKPGAYRTYGITEIHMDEVYDCCRVSMPCPLTKGQEKALREAAAAAAGAVNLTGIMDLEVIDHHGVMKMLEIDARIPSQTPTAVLHGTGVNLISELAGLFTGEWDAQPPIPERRFVSYEHFLVEHGSCKAMGEHIMTQGGPLRHYENCWGADEVLTDYTPGAECFRMTCITVSETEEGLLEKRGRLLAGLASPLPDPTGNAKER